MKPIRALTIAALLFILAPVPALPQALTSSRSMVAEMKKLGVDVNYIEVPGGNHTDIAAPNFPAIFDFFDAHRKKTVASGQ